MTSQGKTDSLKPRSSKPNVRPKPLARSELIQNAAKRKGKQSWNLGPGLLPRGVFRC